jgi:hypothetical protein
MITQLNGLNTLINYSPLWQNMDDSGVIDKLISAGMIMLFGVTCIVMLMNMKTLWSREGREKGVLEVNTQLFVQAIILGFLILFYKEFCDVILKIFSAFSDMFFKESVQKFRVDFRYLIATISGQSDAQTPLFFPSLKTSIEVFLFSVSLNFLIILFYVMILFCPAFLIIILAAGPVLIPIGLYSKNVLFRWFMFLLAAGLFPAFVGLGIQIINSMGYISEMAITNTEGKLIKSLFLTVQTAIFITAIPAVVAELFGARPMAVFSAVMSLMTFSIGLFSTSLNTVAQILISRQKRKM